MESPDPDVLAMKRTSSQGARMVLVLGFTLPLAVGAGIGIGMYLFGAKAQAPAAVASVQKPCPPVPPPPKEPETLIEKAAAGEFKALDELKGKAPGARSLDEAIAFATGRSGNKERALEGFATELKKFPDKLNEPDPRARLREFFTKGETMVQAAAVIASVPGQTGPDLLYDVMTTGKVKTDAGELAEELLATKEMREKASPALLVSLDLRRTEQCEDFKALLPKAAEIGDRRAIPMLLKLANKHGCGDSKRDDCYACLRPLEKDKEAVDLGDAVVGARKRPGPKL